MSNMARDPQGELRPRHLRQLLAGSMVAAVALALFGGGYLNPALAGVGETAMVPFKDVDGRAQTPLSRSDKKACVLFFLLPECPISNSYAPEIQRICSEYAPKKIAAFVVHADPDVTAQEAKKHAKEFGLACPVLLDPAHLLVKKTGVTMAPEVAVVAPDGKILYRGRIDDWYVDYGKRRAAPTQRDLRSALDAILQGKAVPTPRTKIIGCDLPEAKQ